MERMEFGGYHVLDVSAADADRHVGERFEEDGLGGCGRVEAGGDEVAHVDALVDALLHEPLVHAVDGVLVGVHVELVGRAAELPDEVAEEVLQAGLGVVGRGAAALDVDLGGGEEEAHVAAGGRDYLFIVSSIDAGEVVGLEGDKLGRSNVCLHFFGGHIVAFPAGLAI